MNNLYRIIESLCKSKGVTITEMCKQSGASRGSLTDLKMGRKQSLSSGTLAKIATYFGVTVDCLLGATDKMEEHIAGDYGQVGMDDFTYALRNETAELTEDNKRKLLEMARFFKQQQDKENK